VTKWIFFPALFLFILVSTFDSDHPKESRAQSLVGRHTLILYDANSGEIPSSSLMRFTDFPPGTASLTFTDGATILDTTVAGRDTYAGWISNPTTTPGFPNLDPAMGVQVNFTMQVQSEMHGKNDRAGLSMIILDQDAKGIELSFWEDQVWVQSDDTSGGLFEHGEGAAFPTTAGMTNYQVTFAGDAYTLTANSELLLSGPLRDYSKFDGFPDPYETPNLLFLGDNTRSSQARLKLQYISITGEEPIAPTAVYTSTSIAGPPPIASTAPLPTATPTPAGRVVDFCPSSWLWGSMMLANVVIIKIMRRRDPKHS
jgi:hypothetical protein